MLTGWWNCNITRNIVIYSIFTYRNLLFSLQHVPSFRGRFSAFQASKSGFLSPDLGRGSPESFYAFSGLALHFSLLKRVSASHDCIVRCNLLPTLHSGGNDNLLFNYCKVATHHVEKSGHGHLDTGSY
jgi:hypothetical protein